MKEKYARGIVALFPYLSDPYSKNGYVSVSAKHAPSYTWTCSYYFVLYFLHFFILYLCSTKEHYYDGESGTGYLAWRIKTIQRSLAKERRTSFEGTDYNSEISCLCGLVPKLIFHSSFVSADLLFDSFFCPWLSPFLLQQILLLFVLFLF